MKTLRAFLFMFFSAVFFSVNATELINIDSDDSSESSETNISNDESVANSGFRLFGFRPFSLFHWGFSRSSAFCKNVGRFFKDEYERQRLERIEREERIKSRILFKRERADIEKTNSEFKNEKAKENDFGYKLNDSCIICFDDLGDQSVVKTPCNHFFHKGCLKPWVTLNESCPHCRGFIKKTCEFVWAKYKEDKVVKEKEIKRKRAYQDRNDFQENSNDGGFSFKKPKEKDIKNELNEKNNK